MELAKGWGIRQCRKEKQKREEWRELPGFQAILSPSQGMMEGGKW